MLASNVMTRSSVALTLILGACAHSPSHVPTQPAAASSSAPAPWYGDLRALAERAARVRGLELKQTFAIVPLDDTTFFSRHDRQREASLAIVEDFSRTLEVLIVNERAFERKAGDESFRAGLGISREAMKRIREEALLAFYEFDTHTLVVRRERPASLELTASIERATLSRTVARVIQDQRGLGAAKPTGIDEALAWSAVLEGDAALTAILVGADFDDMSLGRAVERVRLTGWAPRWSTIRWSAAATGTCG